MKYFITLDVGTTAVKVALIDEELRILNKVIKEYTLETPGNGIVELDPNIYWESATAGIRMMLETEDVSKENIISVTCTTQGETLIPVDKNGKALRKAIVWLDNRAQQEAEYIASKISAEEFYKRTGVPEINGYCPIAKILWIRNNEPECYKKTFKFLLLEDYLLCRLSGRFATNPSVICTTGYFDINTKQLWNEVFSCLNISESRIPEIIPCGTTVGKVCDDTVSETGLSPDTVVTTGAMDQTAGALGAANIKEGMVCETTGTAMVIAATVKKPDLDRRSNVNVYTHVIEGTYLNISMVQTAGILQKWFRDEFCKDLDKNTAFIEISEMAEQAPPLSGGVMTFPHFTGIQEPYNDPDARGVFFGVGLDSDRKCFIRSIYEGIGYSLRENLEMMGLKPERILSQGGGSKSVVWNQIKADICGAEVNVPEEEESASVGAAILGGVATGIFPDIETAVGMTRTGRSFIPDKDTSKLYERGYRKYRKLYERFRPLFRED